MISFNEWMKINEHKRGMKNPDTQDPSIVDQAKQGLSIPSSEAKPRNRSGRRHTTHETSKNNRRRGTRDARNREAINRQAMED
jgi:hypothetical protein